MRIPVLPYAEDVVLPGSVFRLRTSAARSLAALDAAHAHKQIIIGACRDPAAPAIDDLHAIGVVCSILRSRQAPGELLRFVLLRAEYRCSLAALSPVSDLVYLTPVPIPPVFDPPPDAPPTRALAALVRTFVRLEHRFEEAHEQHLLQPRSLGGLTDAAAAVLPNRALRLALLQDPEPHTRATRLTAHLEALVDALRVKPSDPMPAAPAPERHPGAFPRNGTDRDKACYLARECVGRGDLDDEAVFCSLAREGLDLSEGALRAIQQEAMDAHSRHLATLARPTPAERFRAVLAELEDDGIRSGVPASWNPTDAWAEMAAQLASTGGRGAVFCTTVDLARAVGGQGLHLRFATVTEGDAEALGTDVVAALRAAGLPVWWPERAEVRIYVPIPWDVPRPTATDRAEA